MRSRVGRLEFVGILLFISLFISVSTSALTAKAVYDKVKQAIYTIYIFDADAKTVKGRGSAVAVGKDILVTNCHLVLFGNYFGVKFPDNKLRVARLFYKNEERDLCFLEVPGGNFTLVKIRPSANVEIGEAVYAIGNPKGTEKSLSQGIISNKHSVDGGIWLQTDATIYFGSSGGGLFDDEGNLVGITSKMGGNFGFAMPTEWITQALTDSQIHFLANTAQNGESPSPAPQTLSPEVSPAPPAVSPSPTPTPAVSLEPTPSAQQAIQNLTYLGAYGKDQIGLYRNNRECFLLLPGKDTNGNLSSVILWNPKYNKTVVIFPSTTTAQEALQILYQAMLDKKKTKQNLYKSDSVLYIASQPYPLYGVMSNTIKYAFLMTQFSDNPQAVFLNSRAFRIVFKDTDPKIGEATLLYELNGIAEALSAYNSKCGL